MTSEKLASFRAKGMLLHPKFDRLAAIGDRKKVEEEEEKFKVTDDRYDFLPIVKINNTKEPKNAIISTKECTNHKKAKINLGTDYEEDKREYLVVDIVIAQNSIVKIPLMVKRGYDPWGFQDGDGKLLFSCSNSDVKLSFIDNDDTDYDNDKGKYDLKDAAYGDELVMEIETVKDKSTKKSKVSRGTSFTITVYATDDGDGTSTTSNRKGICGKFNVKIVENDVFLKEEFDKGVSQNKVLVGIDDVCFRVADKQVSSILNNKKLVLNDYYLKNSYDRAFDFKLKGLVKEEKIFSQFVIEGGGVYEPKSYDKKHKNSVSKYFLNSIKDKIGYHYYYFSIVFGDHVLTLMIDNTEPCNVKFKTFDQTEIYKEMTIDKLDEEMLRLSHWIWTYMYKKQIKDII